MHGLFGNTYLMKFHWRHQSICTSYQTYDILWPSHNWCQKFPFTTHPLQYCQYRQESPKYSLLFCYWFESIDFVVYITAQLSCLQTSYRWKQPGDCCFEALKFRSDAQGSFYLCLPEAPLYFFAVIFYEYVFSISNAVKDIKTGRAQSLPVRGHP